MVGLTIGAEPEVSYKPPQEAEYQFQIEPSEPRLPPVIPSEEEELAQIGEVEDAEVGAVEEVFTTIVVLTQLVVPQLPSDPIQ